MSTVTLGSLKANDLGTQVLIEHEMATIVGELTTIQHSKGYKEGRTMITVIRDDWRWTKSLLSDSMIVVEYDPNHKAPTTGELLDIPAPEPHE